eukprot:scaffold42935_cov65-Attheya_sp.AAC.1
MAAAQMSKLVETSIDEDADEDEVQEIPLPNVRSAVLTKVIEYCTHYQTDPMTPITTPLKSSKVEEVVQQWYADFVKVEHVLLFELVIAAKFMDIKPLLDLACFAAKGKSVGEIKKIFDISPDLSPEEEAEIREENK